MSIGAMSTSLPRVLFAGSDHAGVSLRRRLAAHLRDRGVEVVDLGAETDAPSDYPDFAAPVGRAVRDTPGALGLLICGSGIGVCLAANKIRGVRAAAPWSAELARLCRAHNDVNVLCIGQRFVEERDAIAMLDAWLDQPFEGGRHARRVAKIAGGEAGELPLAAGADEASRQAARGLVARIHAGDPGAFTAQDGGRWASIKNRLGWLRAPDEFASRVEEMRSFAAEIKREGFARAVLLGMGGSSLAPEVFATTFGHAAGIPVVVLDNTDPDAVQATERGGALDETLFIVASKSGDTIEVASFEDHFHAKAMAVAEGDAARAGRRFIAITDPDTGLFKRATLRRYRKIFVNPADIGGRYSALSCFGLVPAALLGADLGAILGGARAMAERCRSPHAAQNPGLALGALIGACAKLGRDKLTLVMPPELASFGSWIEQLVAESLGKEGRGVVPIDVEPLGDLGGYGHDRLFVVTHLRDGATAASAETIAALRGAGHPVHEIVLADRNEIGAAMFQWEFATAVAGACMALNPFDEPDVGVAKKTTRELLDAFVRDGKLPAPAATVAPDDVAALSGCLASLGPGDYLALCAFFVRTEARDRLLTEIRVLVRDAFGVATTLGYGPRYLHSTGQLHKGGAANGVFLQLCADPAADLPIPGQPFSFRTLRDAQAQGDLQVLAERRRRSLRVHLGADADAGLRRLRDALVVVTRTAAGATA